MVRSSIIARCALLAVLFIACLPQSAHTAEKFSLEGSEWLYIGLSEDEEDRYLPYVIRFAPHGRLDVRYTSDVTPDDDEWVQQGDKVIFWYNNKYVKHTGKRVTEDLIEGKAVNIRNKSWPFRLERERNWNQQKLN